MLNMFFKAPAKIVLTFVVSMGLFLGAFIWFPNGLIAAQDWSNNISDFVRDWPPDDESTILWRTFTDSNAILAVFMTILSRSIVEMVFQLFGFFFGGMGARNAPMPPRDKPMEI